MPDTTPTPTNNPYYQIQQLNENHKTDGNSLPAGGMTTGLGIDIIWQDGPLVVDGQRQEPNGAFVEGVLLAAMGRLRFYQATKFACEENAAAISYIDSALKVLQRRTDDRTARGVEGTNKV